MPESSITKLLADSRALREQGRKLREQRKHQIKALHKTMDAVHTGWTNILVFREAKTLFNSLEQPVLETTQIGEPRARIEFRSIALRDRNAFRPSGHDHLHRNWCDDEH